MSLKPVSHVIYATIGLSHWVLLRLLFIPVASLVVLSCAGGDIREAASESRYIPGIYEGKGKGMHGDIVARIQCDDRAILAIEIIEHSDTPVISDVAVKEIPLAILKGQETQGVDAISGATETSEGIKMAVQDAVSKALRK
ncbi:MAG: FMN-binding protein [Deltaproteobacteria bacterium]|nr:FMN-binding protein [Deltaproteobacteria bacterium]